MARLILKSPYIKGGAKAVNYVKYIGTRERVELVPDGRLTTKKQEQLIANLAKDFPDVKKLPEYSPTPRPPFPAGLPVEVKIRIGSYLAPPHKQA